MGSSDLQTMPEKEAMTDAEIEALLRGGEYEIFSEGTPLEAEFANGIRFSRLVCTGVIVRNTQGKRRKFALVRCDCGTIRRVEPRALRKKITLSCGCYMRENVADMNRTHGFTSRSGKPTEYMIWQSMKGRTRNPSDASYHRYGARGIKFCERWEDFTTFLSDMGPRPSKRHSIDRIDNGGDYTPDNCRWATPKQQARNKRNSVIVEMDGVRKPLLDWCEEYGVKPQNIRYRLKAGMDPKRAFSLYAGVA